MTESPTTQKKSFLPVFGLVTVLIGLGLLYGFSNLSRSRATATFRPYDRSSNELEVQAPFNTYIHLYSVTPTTDKDQAIRITGGSLATVSEGLFGPSIYRANYYPSKGRFEGLELEKPVLISPTFPMSAVAKMPGNKDVLKRCGLYLFVSKRHWPREELNKSLNVMAPGPKSSEK